MCHDMGFKTPTISRSLTNRHNRVHTFRISADDNPDSPSFVVWACSDLVDFDRANGDIHEFISKFEPKFSTYEIKYGDWSSLKNT